MSEMEAKGLLEKLPSSPEEIENLSSMAQRHLADAQIKGMSAESSLVHAYQAILACATAAFRAENYRVPNIEGKHVHTLDSLRHTLRIRPGEIEYFHTLRRKRHEDAYEGGLHTSDMEAQDALAAARELAGKTVKALKKRFPYLDGGY